MNNPIRYWDPTGHYVSDWDSSHLTKDEIKQLEKITNAWTAANAAGNTKGANSTTYWHDEAEKIRDKYRESNEIGTGDGHTVATANPSPSQTITYSAPLDGQNNKKDSNEIKPSQETGNNNSNKTNNNTIRKTENNTNLITGSTTIAAPMPWEITAPTLGISPKVLIPALIPFVIFWENPIICDDGYFEYIEEKNYDDSEKVKSDKTVSEANAGDGVTEHKKGARNSTKQKHEEGQKRKKTDKPGGEKGDARRNKNDKNYKIPK